MKRTIIYILFLSIIIYGCGHSKNEQLLGTWHVVRMENPEMDSFFVNSQRYIDTMGATKDTAINMALYGAANMDSLRGLMQQQFDSAKNMQMNAVKNTVFTFLKDSVSILSFSGVTDTSKWYIDKEGKLVIHKAGEGTAPETVKMEILALSDTALKLKFSEERSSSIVTFHPEKK
jgi:hypothetical protein